jgi:regulator of replication initiation timing
MVNAILHDVPMDFGPEKHLHYSAASLCAIEQANVEIQWRLTSFEDNVYNSFDNLLQKMDAAWTENTALREAYRACREETAALKAAVDALTKRIDETIATTVPPSRDTATSSTTMEEMTMRHHTAMATPPPAFATTSTETIDYSIGFRFPALIYVSL